MGSREKSIKYYVNEEKRTVVAVMEDTSNSVVDFILANNNNVNISTLNEKKYQIKDKYLAKAVCHKDDVFDVEVGKEIAKYKVLFLHYKDFYNKVNEWVCNTQLEIKRMELKSTEKYFSVVNKMRNSLEKTIM